MKKQFKYVAAAGLVAALLLAVPRTKSLRLSPIRRWRML